MNPPPIGDETRQRILREARLRDEALAEGRRLGRLEASADFMRRLVDLESKVEALWRAAETDETKAIKLPEGPNSG